MAGGSLVPSIATEIERALAEESDFYARMTEENLRVFARGSLAEIFALRARNVGFMWQYLWFFVPPFVAMFLIGAYAGQRRIFQDTEGNLAFIRRVAFWGLAIGLPANALYAIGYELGNALEIDAIWVAGMAG